ncbi:MAG TPA: hypothetical protein VF283_21115 [Bryobacteraceae bacterium]
MKASTAMAEASVTGSSGFRLNNKDAAARPASRESTVPTAMPAISRMARIAKNHFQNLRAAGA